MVREFALSGLVTVLLCVGVDTSVCAAQQAPSPRMRPAPDQPAGDKYDLDRLLRNLDTIKRTPTMLNEQILIRKLNKGVLTFQPTSSNLDILRKAGASEELLKVIARKGGMSEVPTPRTEPQSPPKPKEGHLSVTCKPVDCVVSVDKKEIGATTKGELKDQVLPEGQVTVSAVAKNYIPDTQGKVVRIQDNGLSQVTFVFTVNPAALLEKGNALFNSMLEALGGEGALKAAESFRATGRLDTRDQANKPTTWPFVALISYPAQAAKFTITKNNKKYEILKTDAGFSWKPNPSGQEFNELEDGLRYFLDYQLTKLLDLIRATGANVEAEKLTLGQGDDVVFRVSREAYKYRVKLNSESRPVEVVLESGGLNAGLRILLTDYAKQGAAFLPMTTEVDLPGTGMRGIIVHYESLEVNPTGVKNDEFKPKKGYLNRSH